MRHTATALLLLAPYVVLPSVHVDVPTIHLDRDLASGCVLARLVSCFVRHVNTAFLFANICLFAFNVYIVALPFPFVNRLFGFLYIYFCPVQGRIYATVGGVPPIIQACAGGVTPFTTPKTKRAKCINIA